MIDSSSIGVHQHAANAKKDGSSCMDRSRGGLTTKIDALVDADGLPTGLKLTAGQALDGRSAQDMLETVGEGGTLLADRAYDSDALRVEMAARGAWANVKPMLNCKTTPGLRRLPLSLQKPGGAVLQ